MESQVRPGKTGCEERLRASFQRQAGLNEGHRAVRTVWDTDLLSAIRPPGSDESADRPISPAAPPLASAPGEAASATRRRETLPMTAAALALLLAAVPSRALEAPAAGGGDDPEAAFGRAQASYLAGDYAASARTLEGLLGGMEADGAPPAPRDRWTRALLRLAQVEATLGRGTLSRSAIERALAVEPGLAPDPEQYSPRFRREVEQARARLELAPRFRLAVTTGGAPAAVEIDGQPVGLAPVELLLPSGRYHVGVRAGSAAAGVRVELSRDERLAVDLAGT